MNDREVNENDEKFKKLFKDAPEPMILIDEGDRISDINSRFEQEFGYKLEEIKAKKVNDIVVPERLKEEGQRLDKKSSQGYTNYETVREGKDGEFHVSISATPVEIDDKNYKIITYKNIEKRKKAEKELKRRGDKFRKFFNEAPDPMIHFDDNDNVLNVNSRFEEVFGYELEEIKGKHINDIIVPERKMKEAKELDEKTGEKFYGFETVRKGKHGELNVSISATPIDFNGNTHSIATYKNIEKRKEAEKTYQEIFTNTHDAMWIVNVKDDEYIYERVNSQYANNFVGLGKDNVEGKNLQDLFKPDTVEAISENYKEVIEKKKPIEKEQHLEHPIGERWHLTALTPILDEEGNVEKIIGSGKDITEQKEMEQKLEERVEESEETIKELSTPVINVWDNIIAMPLVGVIDTKRAEQITENLLQAIKQTEAEVAILDVSGVPVIDTEVANRLIRTVKAASLLGTETIIAGIRPDIAESIVHLGVDLSGIETHSSLQTGLKAAFKKIGYEVNKNE